MKKYLFLSITLVVFSLPSCAFQSPQKIAGGSMVKSNLSFEEVFEDFPRVEKDLRKWDAPVVADLDQDGYPDLVLNDHGLGIQICWNNKGKFAKPYDLIMGDLHGVSVGDYDQDGNLEMIVSRGGGSGGNARNSKMFRVDKKRNFTEVPDFKVPLALMRGRTVKFMDGDNDGDLDLVNFAFPGKEKNGESENYIYENDGKDQMVLNGTLPFTERDGQKTLVTDFNGDKILDLILYGHQKAKAFRGKGDLTYEEVTDKIFPKDITDVTGIVEIDFDNDGDFDLYFARGKDFEIGETYYDLETQNFGFYSKRGKSSFKDLPVGDVIQVINLQSQWPHNDALYLGETGYPYDFPGETHSGKHLRLVNSNVLGFPDKTNEDGGIHLGYVGNQNWRLLIDSWSPTTGVIGGVMSYPAYDHSLGLVDVLLENNNGIFKDVTTSAKLELPAHTVQSTVADFDNNGFSDILVMPRGKMIYGIEALMFLNQGNGTFSRMKKHQMVCSELGAIGMAVNSLDYNQDGKIDVVIGNERGKWHLFKNQLPASEYGNYSTIEVGTSPSGKATALGALVEIESCQNKQVERIGSTGAAYSLSFNNFVHFGLGNCEKPINVKVTWSNGEILEQTISTINTKVSIKLPK